MAKRRKIRPKARPKARPRQRAYSPDFFPTGIGGPNYAFGGKYNVAGGMDEAKLKLDTFLGGSQVEQGRQGQAQNFLEYLTNLQSNPFSIVPALQAYGAAGGGGAGPAAALAASGGAGQPSQYGDIADNLFRSLSEFTGGTEINPVTGMPFTGEELGAIRSEPWKQAYRDQMKPKPKQAPKPKPKAKPKYLKGEYKGPNTPAVTAYRDWLAKKKAGQTKGTGTAPKAVTQ